MSLPVRDANAVRKYERRDDWESPVEISSVKAFNSVLGKTERLLIFFYMVGCGHCERYWPTHNYLARVFHRAIDGARPVTVAVMNGPKFADLINKELGTRVVGPYPTILMVCNTCASDDDSSPLPVQLYQGDRSISDLTDTMATFFGDDMLRSIPNELCNVMPVRDEALRGVEYVLFYDGRSNIIPKGFQRLHPYMTDVQEMGDSLCSILYMHPAMARRGAAVDVAKVGRLDVITPSVYLVKEDKFLELRDAVTWFIEQLDRYEQPQPQKQSRPEPRRGTSSRRRSANRPISEEPHQREYAQPTDDSAGQGVDEDDWADDGEEY